MHLLLYRWTVVLGFFVFLACMGNSTLHAQNPVYRHYSVKEGLPSSEVYHVYQDSKGFIWFATDLGVARFDGDEFQIFDLEDGLPDNTIFEIYEDYRGRIWFLSFNLQLSYFHKGKIKKYRYNNVIQGIQNIERRIYQKNTFYVDSSDNIYLGIKNVGVLKIDSLGNLTNLNNIHTPKLEYFTVDEKSFLIYKPLGKKGYKGLMYYYQGDTARFSLDNIRQKVELRCFSLKKNQQSILYFSKNLCYFDGLQMKDNQYIEPEVVWMSRDSKDRLWLGTTNGCLRYNDFGFCSGSRRYLEGKTVSSVLEDHEGGYWFSTIHNGVYYTPDLNVLTYSGEDVLISNNISKLEVGPDGSVWIGYTDAAVGKLENGQIVNRKIKVKQKGQPGISLLAYDKFIKGLWLGRWDGFYFYDTHNEIFKYKKLLINNRSVKSASIADSSLWLGLAEHYLKYSHKKNEIVYNSCKDDQFCRRIEALHNKNDTLYLGSLDGLWMYANQEYTHLGNVNDLFYHRITNIQCYKNYIIIGTRGAGILIKKGNEVLQITEDDGLPSNSINALALRKDELWVANNRGISRIQLLNVEAEKYRIANFGTYSGLPSSETNDLAVVDSMIYVGTGAGLTCFNATRMEPNKNSPAVFIKNIKINDSDTLIKNAYKLSYDQNFFTIDYKGLTYKKKGPLLYRYRMLGLDSVWKETERNVKSFTTLPPGNYTFQVKASNESGVWTPEPVSVNFTIDKPFWKTWWFITLVVLVIGGLLWAFLQYRVRMIKRRKELLQSINEYKQKILRQQMNPHFIFNTLNSIQYFLLDDDTTSSLTYLSKFAKLMRIVLENSQHTFVSIEEEIRGLELYLELESLRFEELFEYDINVDNEINTFDYKIPALLVQPYVENSIRHGLLHKKGNGYLKVHLKKEEQSILCIIEDNGVGRKKAEEIKKKKGHLNTSLGSKITEERIGILNSLYSDEIDINYVDLKDREGSPRGTRVEIQLPFVY